AKSLCVSSSSLILSSWSLAIACAERARDSTTASILSKRCLRLASQTLLFPFYWCFCNNQTFSFA
ncbi:MAG: hypothetical protein ACRC8K_06545, partial [Waterburya sp.]